MESGWKPYVEISPNCPRCGSSNTKFCYYNNYSLTQPRYFCKGCRRYWTKGGSLRNVPVGGGCRKNRRVNKTSLIQSIHRNLPNGDAASDPRKNPSSSSSLVSDAPNIDLALVYANYLNQNPDSKAGIEKPDQMQAVFDSSVEHSSQPNPEVGSSVTLPDELDLSGCLNLSEQFTEISQFCEGNQTYLCGFNSTQKNPEYRIDQCSSHNTINFELPPLPGEEAGFRHDMNMMWSNSETMTSHALHATQSPLFGPESHDADLLVGNWCPFDLPRDASLSRP